MSYTMDHWLDLNLLVKAGFPVNDEQKAAIEAKDCDLLVEIKFESMGSSGNGWDDPGEGAEWYVDRYWSEQEIESLFPLTPAQVDWLNEYDKLDEVAQQWAADSSNWYDSYDD